MRYDLKPFEDLVEQGYLRKSEDKDLVLYGYTDKCTYDKHWNEYTRIARGLILEKKTGKIIAKPFPKFFNLGEMQETMFWTLPDLPYTITEKVDGSLGIVFYHGGRWRVATRGSLFSDQAKRAESMLSKYNLPPNGLPVTILVEIVYPENRIIVNYGDKEELVLLGAYLPSHELEIHRADLEDLAKEFGFPLVPEFDVSIEEMIEKQKTWSGQEEGVVVRFYNGLRVKIKGEEYMRISRMISGMSPLALWETMKEGRVDISYIQQLPEELRTQYERIQEELEFHYRHTLTEIKDEFERLPTQDQTPQARKTVGLFLQSPAGQELRHAGAMFHVLLGNKAALDKYIKERIRPKANVLKEIV